MLHNKRTDRAEEIEALKLLYNGNNIHLAEAISDPGQSDISGNNIETLKLLLVVSELAAA